MPNSLAYTEFTKGQRIYKGTENLQRDREFTKGLRNTRGGGSTNMQNVYEQT